MLLQYSIVAHYNIIKNYIETPPAIVSDCRVARLPMKKCAVTMRSLPIDYVNLHDSGWSLFITSELGLLYVAMKIL